MHSKNNSGLNGGAIAAIVVGGVVAAFIAFYLLAAHVPRRILVGSVDTYRLVRLPTDAVSEMDL